MCILPLLAFLITVHYFALVKSSSSNEPLPTDLDSGFKVSLDLFVMSKCPDAVRCEQRMNDVLKTVQNISKVQTHYIADVAGQNVQCKHGISECLGNQQQLCMLKHTSPQAFWGFIQCQNQDITTVGTSSSAERCLDQVLSEVSHESVIHKVRSCFNGKEATQLLRESATFTKDKGVVKSCTMWVNGKPRCVHDGGIWYDCPGGPEVEDFIDSICSSYWKETGHWAKDCEDSSSTSKSVA
ncbi:hypothetical protein CEUSTIGMA_g12761.t1 [Chlamydomonas eustigma]|uniref:Gamma interferon inducible lysosomal thiol reductase GILT n=1 Tax=Chlamydomonas eustigma TaxID=1157962 RepID=A0A250XQL0_9CHLO|nr:hypothetical protein CEUSTIGMA_g12761.t1 [Chlamydomonas eustigma]|eukprot:GAX85344.1 hypothetical protein CEUSTIGMA_g12761.t1 [Chlamydomonas eustigma]